jgi:hypothetical protein
LGDGHLHHAETRASIYGRKTRPAAVCAESNSRFRCYRDPKLIVALWRYVTTGAVPEGAVLKA